MYLCNLLKFKIKKLGALTKKDNVFSSRPWELRSDAVIDITNPESLELIISTGVGVVQVYPRIVKASNFRWINDLTRFYYGKLHYGIKKINEKVQTRKNILKMDCYSTELHISNLSNLFSKFISQLRLTSKTNVLFRYSNVCNISFGFSSIYLFMSKVSYLSKFVDLLNILKNSGKFTHYGVNKPRLANYDFVKFNYTDNLKYLSSNVLILARGFDLVYTRLNFYLKKNNKNFFFCYKNSRRFAGSVLNFKNTLLDTSNNGVNSFNSKIFVEHSLKLEYLKNMGKVFNMLACSTLEILKVYTNNIFKFFNIFSWLDSDKLSVLFNLENKISVSSNVNLFLYTYKYKEINSNSGICVPQDSFLETGGSIWNIHGKRLETFRLGRISNNTKTDANIPKFESLFLQEISSFNLKF